MFIPGIGANLGTAKCGVWVLSFARVGRTVGSIDNAELASLRELVNSVETRYKLVSSEGNDADELQTAIFRAAHWLIWEDVDSLEYTCAWFKKHEIALNCPQFSRRTK